MRMKTLLAAVFAAMSLALAALPLPAAASKNMEVLAVGGVVEVGAKSDAKWNQLLVGYPLLPGKGVRCGVTGGAVMRWFSGNVVKMRHLTSLQVNELSTDASGIEKTEIEVLYGQIFVLAKPLAAPESMLRVKTPTSAADVRGSAEYSISIDSDGKTTFNVMEGQITVEAQGIAVLIDSGFQITVDKGQPPGEIITMPTGVKTDLLAESKKVRNALKVPAPPPPQMAGAETQPAVHVAQAPAASASPAPDTAAVDRLDTHAGSASVPANTAEGKKPAGKDAQPASAASATAVAKTENPPDDKHVDSAASTLKMPSEITFKPKQHNEKSAQAQTAAPSQPAATSTARLEKSDAGKTADAPAKPAASEKKAESATSTATTPDATAKAKKPDEKKAESQKQPDVKPAADADKSQARKKPEEPPRVPADGKKPAPAPAPAEKKSQQPPEAEQQKAGKSGEAAPAGENHQEVIEDMLEFILSE